MAIASNIVFLANGYDLAVALTGFTFTADGEELDATTVSSTGAFRSYVQGFKSGSLQGTGIFDSDETDADRIHDVLSAAYTSGTAQNVTASRGAVTVGAPAIMMDGSVMTYDIPHDTGALIMANATWRANASIKFGRWLMYAAQAEGTDNGTSVDNAASSANGGFLQVHLHNDDATDVDVKLQHSTNDTDWVDVTGGVVSDLSATRASGSASVSGTINRYTRVVATVTGGDTFLISAAFARG